MSRFTKLAPVAALAALAASAAPALAAPHDYNGHRDSPAARHGYPSGDNDRGFGNDHSRHYAGFGQAAQIRRDIARLDARIDRALARYDISPREAFALRRDVRELDRLYARFARGGMTHWEARTLEARLAEAYQAFRFERRDNDRRRG